MIRVYLAEGMKNGLRPAQWDALRYFATAPYGERSVTAFARAQATTKGTASLTVSSLVKKGLLERGQQKRNVNVRISARGRRLLENSDPALRLAETVASLSDAEKQALARAAQRFIAEVGHSAYDATLASSDSG